MNYWQDEYMTECHRQRILDDVEQIRLEKLALKARVLCSTLFERIMFTFANWMISKGKQLRKRYEAAVNCGDPVRVASQINR